MCARSCNTIEISHGVRCTAHGGQTVRPWRNCCLMAIAALALSGSHLPGWSAPATNRIVSISALKVVEEAINGNSHVDSADPWDLLGDARGTYLARLWRSLHLRNEPGQRDARSRRSI